VTPTPEPDAAPIDLLSDTELAHLNELLPWSAFTLDAHGRALGLPYSASKRSTPQRIPDKRIVELNELFSLSDKTVLEIGCFEGIHTCGLSRFAREVVALDSRVENVAKTLVRCGLLGYRPRVLCWDLEDGLPPTDMSHDILHHVGVLYHLSDPVRHLYALTALTRVGVMLDTHVADETSDRIERYEVGTKAFRCAVKRESGRAQPFAGMRDYARWLVLDDLRELLESCGFEIIKERVRSERNGPRVLIFGCRAR